jgi:sn-glycerol 3-phosphate transport system ATP-binding protein
VLLRDGHIEQDAPPEEIYARPETAFAASFIGTPPMNLFPLERRDSGMVIRGTNGPSLAPAIDAAITGGIRPEHLRLADVGIPAVVRHAEYLGADTVLACEAGDATLLVRLPGRVVPDAGTQVHLATDEAVHLFDAANGLRVTPREGN